MNAQIIVENPTQVAHARRDAVALARRVALDDASSDRLALAVTEAATNLLKHASGGQVLLAPLPDPGAIGIEVIAIDRGSGMANVAASMRDGHSTAGGPGLGLGSIARLATDLDIYSQAGRGTVLRFEIRVGQAPAAPAIRYGGVCIAKHGESVTGDAWTLQSSMGHFRMMVVDGLGHGPDAAVAAHTAVGVAARRVALAPDELLDAMHGALRGTRGAAAAVAAVTPHAATGICAGIGNIRCFVRAGGAERSLVSHNGTLGHQIRKIQAFEFAFPPRALLVMHSDGIATHWTLDQYPGIDRHHPAVIAATILRDHARPRDDATVAILRHEAPFAS
jgi:anti-sigma regulatory factor (Ser/Thr protein kinase)